jgi:amidohydrolase
LTNSRAFPHGASSRDILARVEALYPQQVAWRRHLHQWPELSNEEIKTTAYLKSELRRLGVGIRKLDYPTGVLAQLTFASPGPTVAIRSDIDALPVTEQTGLAFRSRKSGLMHACGHDMHMATVLGAAAVLAGMKKQLRGSVRFIFQPAEETPPGGAEPMIQHGALKDVAMIFGLHVDPEIPVGTIGLRDGPAMASVLDFDVVIRGRGGHAAMPHRAVDALAAAAEVIESVQKIVSRETDPMQAVVIAFGKIAGGSARNVVPEEVRLEGTARTLSTAEFKHIPSRLKRTIQAVGKAHGAGCEIILIASYPVLKNDPRINRIISTSFASLFDTKRILVSEPVLGAEDFACYLEKVPGAMFRLGVGNKKLKADQPWHSSRFMVDERALTVGTALLVASVVNVLKNGDT